MDSIFTVTTLTPLGKKHCSRAVGWYPTLEEAKETVINNSCDIQELLYTYAVIEEVGPHLYPDIKTEVWFEWKDGKFCPIDKPQEFWGLCNWSMG